MNKLEYLNDADGNMDDYEIKPLTDIEKQKMKSKFRNSIKKRALNNYKKYAAAAMTVLLLSSGVYTYKVNANLQKKIDLNNPELAKLATVNLSELEQVLGIRDRSDISKYRNTINDLTYDKGVGACLNEVIVDYNQIILITTFDYSVIDTKDKSKFFPDDRKMTVAINGNEVEKTRLISKMDDRSSSAISTKIDENTYTYYYSIPLNGTYNGEDINIDVTFNNISKMEGKAPSMVSGKWNFNTTVSYADVIKDTKIIEPNKDVNFDGGRFRIDKLIISPISTKIFYSHGTDDSLGADHIGFECYANGTKVDVVYGRGGMNPDGRVSYTSLFQHIGSEIKTIEIKPNVQKFVFEVVDGKKSEQGVGVPLEGESVLIQVN